jgi:SAM-dependent methyltransferase
LSKGPNTKDDPSEEDSERRLRRRRKGGGLRVPSDNVPRRPSSRPDSGEFSPQPGLDDSRAPVALAFDDRIRRPSSAPGQQESGADMESPGTEPSTRRPIAGADGDLIEVELSESTDREAELLGEDGDGDLTQVDAADDEEVARRRNQVIGGRRPAEDQPPLASLSGILHDGNSSLDYPLLEDDYEDEQQRRQVPGPDDGEFDAAGADRPSWRPSDQLDQHRADSVDIPIEEVLDGGSGRIGIESSGPFGGEDGRASNERTRKISERFAAQAAEVAAARAAVGLSDGTPRPIGRAQTMALSDADLEEYDDDDEPPPSSAADSADAGWNLPGLDDWGEPAGPSILGAIPAPVPVPAEQVKPARARPMTNRDPSDSGEIIDEELIEEIEESQRAAARELERAAVVSPPPIDLDSTLDLDGDDDVEELPVDLRETIPRLTGNDAHAAAQAAKQKPPPAPAPHAARAAAAAAAAAAADPSQAKPRRRRGKPWFEDIFDEDYLRTLPFLTPQATQMEAQFVMDALAIAAGTQVLDVGCGYGRHAMELAARGYHVVGLDSSLPLLLRGADEAQRRGLTINFVHGDMRDMAFDAQFDGAYCLFSTFGYFDDETNKKTAQNICRALKPGARCVFEVLNRDYIIAELPLRVWWEGDGCVVLEEVDFNYFSSRLISNRSVVFDDGRQLEQEISIRSFALHELGKLLHSAGFRVVEVSGNMITKGRFFGAQSRDIVVIAERRVERPGSPADAGGRIP